MSEHAFIEGDRVTLRPAEPDDAEFLRETVNDNRVWKPMFTESKFPTTQSEQQDWVTEMADRDDAVAFVIRVDGDRVGSIALFDLVDTTGSAEVGYHVAPDAQGNGYATDALTCLVEYAFDYLRVHKLYAHVHAFNDASRDVLESVGFVREGVLREEGYHDGEYCDIHYYGHLASERSRSDSTPEK